MILYLQIFAPALRACIAGPDIQVTSFADTSEEAVCRAVDASVNFMKQRLLETHRKVKSVVRAKAKIQEEAGKQPNKKFSMREISTGSIDDFHEGLHDRIGELQLYLRFCPPPLESAGKRVVVLCKCVTVFSQDRRIWIFSKPCARST
jgi:hypothetical protein